MRRALELAALGPARGVNPRVGCVILSPDGNMTLLNERVCNRPSSIQPAAPKKLLITCEEGTVALYAD